MTEIYNALQHYAEMRKRIVSDIPDDISLDTLTADNDIKELLLRGIPLVRECIMSIYDSVSEYAAEKYVTPAIIKRLAQKGGVMSCNRDAQQYLNTVFHSLLALLTDGTFDINSAVLENSKFNTVNYVSSRRQFNSLKFKSAYTRHLDRFCRVNYYKDGRISDWRNCDIIVMTFDDTALGYTLWFMSRNKPDLLHFYYGDFRVFSESGRKEDRTKFPESVRKKVVGDKKNEYYRMIDSFIYDNFIISGIGENWYQGSGSFGLSKAYETTLDKTELRLWMGENKLTLEVYFSYTAFERLPEIIELLSENARTGILSKRQCGRCSFLCKKCRRAVFDKNIFPPEVFVPCNMGGEGFDINTREDYESAIIIFKHILKYTEPGKGKTKNK
ncbi:MAG: hypothetical protein ACYCWE_17725 [Eubacteriales bacterium]